MINDFFRWANESLYADCSRLEAALIGVIGLFLLVLLALLALAFYDRHNNTLLYHAGRIRSAQYEKQRIEANKVLSVLALDGWILGWLFALAAWSATRPAAATESGQTFNAGWQLIIISVVLAAGGIPLIWLRGRINIYRADVKFKRPFQVRRGKPPIEKGTS